MSMEFNLENN